jgi:inosine-uridine nucleoside N-ribohydrolase
MESRGSSRLVWCDTDAGFDDLLAIGALANNGVLRLVTTTSGACEDAEIGAERVRGLLGVLACASADVVAGLIAPQVPHAKRWLIRARADMHSWAQAHLSNGITCNHAGEIAQDKMCADGDEQGAWRRMEAAIAHLLEGAEDSSIHIVCLGSLTNIARLVSTPALGDLVQRKVRDITIMGGNAVFEQANELRPEFNFMSDPGAAAVVLKSSWLSPKLKIIGMDVCRSDDPSHNEGVDRLCRGWNILSSLASADSFACVCDPLAAFCALHPDELQWCALQLDVDAVTGIISEVPPLTSVSTFPAIDVAKAFRVRAKYFDWLVESAQKVEGG